MMRLVSLHLQCQLRRLRRDMCDVYVLKRASCHSNYEASVALRLHINECGIQYVQFELLARGGVSNECDVLNMIDPRRDTQSSMFRIYSKLFGDSSHRGNCIMSRVLQQQRLLTQIPWSRRLR